MLKYLLDTSTLSAAIGPKPSRSVLVRLTQHGHYCAIASVVWGELLFGCERLEHGRRREELESYLRDVVARSFPILAYDVDAATWHGKERARLERRGRPCPFVDGQIAAVAVVNGLTLITSNIKDFASFRGLEVEDWVKSSGRR